jgi:hypothetical protein
MFSHLSIKNFERMESAFCFKRRFIQDLMLDEIDGSNPSICSSSKIRVVGLGIQLRGWLICAKLWFDTQNCNVCVSVCVVDTI